MIEDIFTQEITEVDNMQAADPFTLLITFLQERWIQGIIAILTWIGLFIINRLAKRNLRRAALTSGLHPDAVNGIVLAVRLGLIYFGIMTFFLVFPELLADFIGIWNGTSLLLGTAIGLAVGQAVNNFVSGLYIMFSRPFSINDYVQIGNKEGIVREISLNYTRIKQQDGTNALIPNNKALTSDIVNFSYDKSKLKLEEEESTQKGSNRWEVFQRISDLIETEKIVRYVFTLKFHASLNLTILNKIFTKVTQEWKPKFGFKPLYELADVDHMAYTYLFTIFVEEPNRILEHKSKFIEDIMKHISETKSPY